MKITMPDVNNHLSLYAIHDKINNVTGQINDQTAGLSNVIVSNAAPSLLDHLWWDTNADVLKRWTGVSWQPLTDTSGVFVSNQPPTDTSKVWLDTTDENLSSTLNASFESEIRTQLNGFKDKTDKLHYALSQELDPGYFKGILPGSDPDNSSGSPLEDGAKGTVGHILVKRGYKADIEALQEGEFGFCIDTEELYIGNKGGLKLLAKVGGTGGSGGSGNVTADYVELISPNGTKYRLTVNDSGDYTIFNSKVDTDLPPATTDAGRFKGLFINKVYAGGGSDVNSTPVSHSCIELYNSTDSVINLKGLSLQYGEYLQPWKVLALRGQVQPYSSFLIRCAQHSDPYRQSTRFKILDFDMSWDIPLSVNGYKLYLCVGADATTFTNPANTDGSWTKAIGYINMFATGGEDITRVIDGYEKTYLHLASKYKMLKRKYSEAVTSVFSNTDDNGYDIEAIDMRSASIDIYMPRSSRYGQWTYHYNQLPLDTYTPNVINVCFGQNGDTSRTFTWQSQVTDKGYLKYRKKTDTTWLTVPSTKQFVAHPDVDVTVHSAIVKGLVPGTTYVYKAGWEGHWSDEYELRVEDATSTSGTIKMLWVTDQQGWDISEYSAWGKANAYIEKTETYDFILNTGDISQNGNRSFEWREYYDNAKQNMSSHVQMTCVGNNDLVDKLYSIAYTYYSTVENSPYPSVYSFNYGFCHFICLDSNILTDPLDSSKFIRGTAEQIAFVKDDMDPIKHPENQKRWRIAYMHESPYTIIRNSKLTAFIAALYDAGVDLVLCGHHHCYTRSNRMGKLGTGNVDVIDNANGVYYLMLQASGYKLSGKTTPTDPSKAPWRAFYDKPGDPCYGMFEITYNKIKFTAYRMTNIMPLIDNVGKDVVPIVLDTLEILPKANRG